MARDSYGEYEPNHPTQGLTAPSPGQEAPKEIPGKLEYFEGKLCEVKNASRTGWWRFHEHYDRDGYCDNPARGY